MNKTMIYLCEIIEWAKGNRGSKSINPYAVPEIKKALQHIAESQGIKDYLDAKTDLSKEILSIRQYKIFDSPNIWIDILFIIEKGKTIWEFRLIPSILATKSFKIPHNHLIQRVEVPKRENNNKILFNELEKAINLASGEFNVELKLDNNKIK